MRGGHQVVAGEQLGGLAGDLRVQLGDAGGAVEFARPVAGFGQIRMHHAHRRMQLAQDLQVVRVLVDRHQLGVTLLFEFDDQVLSDQPGGSGDDDLGVCVGHVRA